MSDEKKLEQINLKVKGQSTDSPELFFKVKMTTPFSKLFNAYCERVGKSLSTQRFMFDGQRLSPNDTPAKVNLISFFY